MPQVPQIHVIQNPTRKRPVKPRKPPRLVAHQRRHLGQPHPRQRRRLVQQPRRDGRQQRHVGRVREKVAAHRRVQRHPRVRDGAPRREAEVGDAEERGFRVAVGAVDEDLEGGAVRVRGGGRHGHVAVAVAVAGRERAVREVVDPLDRLEDDVGLAVGPGGREDAAGRGEVDVVPGRGGSGVGLGDGDEGAVVEAAEVAALDHDVVAVGVLGGLVGRGPEPHVVGDLRGLGHGVHLEALLVGEVEHVARRPAGGVDGDDVGVVPLKVGEGVGADEGVVCGQGVSLHLVLLAPLLLGGGDVPAELVDDGLVVAVDDDVGRHGGLGGLDLEVAHREAVARVDLEELGGPSGLHEFVGRDGALETGLG